MALFNRTATDVIQLSWNRLNALPGGVWIFNQLLRLFNPYSGSIRPNVTALCPGYARIELQDRRRIRNHLNSIHALALANLGELTSGLALLSGLPNNTRGIPTKITTDYYKKARGKLVAECHSGLPDVSETMDYEVSADIQNSDGEVVAHTVVNWRLDPVKQ